jgi:hypothetical protein
MGDEFRRGMSKFWKEMSSHHAFVLLEKYFYMFSFDTGTLIV